MQQAVAPDAPGADGVDEPQTLTEALLVALVELVGRLVVNTGRIADALEKRPGAPPPSPPGARRERAERCDDCGSGLIRDGKCMACGSELRPDEQA